MQIIHQTNLYTLLCNVNKSECLYIDTDGSKIEEISHTLSIYDNRANEIIESSTFLSNYNTNVQNFKNKIIDLTVKAENNQITKISKLLNELETTDKLTIKQYHKYDNLIRETVRFFDDNILLSSLWKRLSKEANDKLCKQ